MFESFRSTDPAALSARQRGFTLIELLISAAITVLIVVMLGTMFGSLTTTASRANRRIDAFRDARAALQIIERDLTGLIKAHDSAYFALDNRWQPGAGDAQDPYSVQTSLNPNHQLYALIALKNRVTGKAANETGDVCTVGYYCKWEGDPTNGYHYTLKRFFRHSVDTYNIFKANVAGGGLTYVPAGTLYTPTNTDDVLASHVWNLKITAFKDDGTTDTTYPSSSLIVTDPGRPTATLPTAIEIQFNAMSPEAAKTVMAVSQNPQDWMDSSSAIYLRLVLPNLYQFRTRVDFH